jgi:hypothetical protein
LQPIGRAKGIHPGRVVWVHDPQVLDWKGPGDGHWYEANHLRQERIDEMLLRAVYELTGETGTAKAWDKLFRHLNHARRKGNAAYRAGERILIKPNWVGMIWREGAVDPESYTLIKRQDAQGARRHRCDPLRQKPLRVTRPLARRKGLLRHAPALVRERSESLP